MATYANRANKFGTIKYGQNGQLDDYIPDKLIEIEAQIKKFEGNIREYGWQIGKRLNEIDKNYLKETGYDNIKDYALNTFGYSFTTTTNLKKIASIFTKEHARDFGSKLRLLSGLEENDIKKYLSWMENDDPTFREIEEKLKKDFPKKGRPKKTININNTILKVDFRKLGKNIPKEKQKNFLKALEKLIEKYSG
jgi:hypothetical protein